MSHIEITACGDRIRRRDIVDDLKEFIQRYEFNESENDRLTKDYQELEVENERLKDMNFQLMAALGRQTWKQMSSSAMAHKANKRKWRAR